MRFWLNIFNRVSLKKLANRNSTIRAELERMFPGWSKNQPKFPKDSDFNNFRDTLAGIFSRVGYNAHAELDNNTMHQLYNLYTDNDDFIEWLQCAKTYTDQIECKSLTRIDSLQTRKCTTILHKGAIEYDKVHHKEYFNSTQQSVNDIYSHFDPKDVIKIVLNFKPEDYADLRRQIGARIIFHDNAYVASQRDLDFFVTRGYRYDFTVNRRDIKILDAPYANCRCYNNNMSRYIERVNPKIPLSGVTCVQNCINLNLIHHAKCWSTTYPYFKGDSFDTDRNIRPCFWYKGSYHNTILKELARIKKVEAAGGNISEADSDPEYAVKREQRDLMRLYRRVTRFCWSQCTLSCRFSEYSVTVTRSVWPSDIEVLFDETGEKRLMRHCCALLAVKYPSFLHKVHEFQPKYRWEDTLGNLGGVLAFWLSVSILSIRRAVEHLLHMSFKYIKLYMFRTIKHIASFMWLSWPDSDLTSTRRTESNRCCFFILFY